MRPLVIFFLAPLLAASAACSADPADDDPSNVESEYTSSATKIVKLAAGASHTCAIVETGAVRCWGWNGFGQLGINRWDQYVSANAREIPAVDLQGRRAVAIAAQHHRTCVLLDDDRAACWGGRGSVAPEYFRLDDRPKATAIAVGAEFQCALFDDGAVKCWGEHSAGQLGRGSPFGVADPSGAGPIDLGTRAKATQIEAGGNHACALLEGGAVKCWGGNESSQLGHGNRGDGYGRGFFQMGDDLRAVRLGTGRRAVAVTAGSGHSCALLDDRSIKCWGSNSDGSAGADRSDVLVGDRPEEMGDALRAVELPAGFAPLSISARGRTTCAVLAGANDARRIACWGYNSRGQLGLGDKVARYDALTAIDLGGGRASAIVPGGEHTCALFDGGRVKCWGMSLYGDLGIGRQGQDQDVGDQPGEMGDALPFVTL